MKERGDMKGTKKFLIGGAVSALMLAGYLYEKRSGARDFDRLKPPGKRIPVNGHSLYIHAMGERLPGRPTVVMESGHGDWSMCWRKVQPEVAKFSRVVAYDRAGFGWSDSGPLPRSPEQIVDELHVLLERAGEKPPYLFVGHSMGAPLSRTFHRCYPNEVAGFVWVDPAHEQLGSFFSFWPKVYVAFQLAMRLGLALATFGVPRLMGKGAARRGYAREQDDPAGAVLPVQVATPKFFKVLYDETESLMAGKGWDGAPTNLGDLPVISIEVVYPDRPQFGYPVMYWDHFRAGWRAMQQSSAGLSTNQRRIPVEGGHVVMLEHPQVVIDAVREMYEKIAQRVLGG